MQVIAYTYEADYHCVPCTLKRFPSIEDPYLGQFCRDSEDNPPHAVFETDEWYANAVFLGDPEATLLCGTCGDVIDEIDLDEIDLSGQDST